MSASDKVPQVKVAPHYSDMSCHSRTKEDINAVDVMGRHQHTKYPNKWSRIREYFKEPAAEFLGTMILIIFGVGGLCQTVLSSDPNVASAQKGQWLSMNLGWAAGLTVALWISVGISGGHLNPAVTLALATVRDFPWKKVPIYMAAQLMGALCGAGICYANYFHAIDIYEGGRGIRTVPGTAGLFATYALPYMTPISCFFSEFLGSAVLIIAILAVTDKKNGPASPGVVASTLSLTILGLGISLGMETSYGLNPARDIGPRLMTAMVGYGTDVFTYRNQYWLWAPLLGPFLGMQAGALLYDILVFTGSESIINKPDAHTEKKHAHAYSQDGLPSLANV